jgi:putative ABC transport system permease protein
MKVNILGLSISMVSCLLILMFIFNELRYDRHFREADQLYRLYFKGQMGGNYLEAATTGGSLGKILHDEIPEVIDGDPSSALVNPKSIVMTESMAEKYFGKENPVGKPVQWNNEESYMVTGVIGHP